MDLTRWSISALVPSTLNLGSVHEDSFEQMKGNHIHVIVQLVGFQSQDHIQIQCYFGSGRGYEAW